MTFDFSYVFDQTVKTVLRSPYVNLIIEPTRKDHRLVIDFPSVGSARALIKSESPYVLLEELAIDANSDNLVIIPNILAVSGSIRVVADGNGLKVALYSA